MHTALRLIVYCLCLTLGILILLSLIFPEHFIPPLLVYVQGIYSADDLLPKLTPMMSAIILVLIPMALSFRWLAKHRFAREITYATANGRVSVNLQAMEEALSRAVMNEPRVKHVVVRIHEDRIRRMVVIQAVLTLWAEENITATNQRCQDVLSKRFAELMPEQRSVQVFLSVNRLRHRQSTEFHHALRERDESESDSITPGLLATEGLEGNDAGRNLLEKTRRRKQTEDGAQGDRSDTDYGEKSLPRTEQRVQTDRIAQPLARARDAVKAVDDDDPFGNMYQGPVYSVPDDEEDNLSGESLPVI